MIMNEALAEAGKIILDANKKRTRKIRKACENKGHAYLPAAVHPKTGKLVRLKRPGGIQTHRVCGRCHLVVEL